MWQEIIYFENAQNQKFPASYSILIGQCDILSCPIRPRHYQSQNILNQKCQNLSKQEDFSSTFFISCQNLMFLWKIIKKWVNFGLWQSFDIVSAGRQFHEKNVLRHREPQISIEVVWFAPTLLLLSFKYFFPFSYPGRRWRSLVEQRMNEWILNM